MSTPLPDPALLSTLERIATALERLSPLADYAQSLLIQATGEKVHEVGSWVLSTTSQGEPCVYLYATHPGLQFRVCTVYIERFEDLPFDPQNSSAKTYDGEAAPTREGAAKKGYLNSVQPFKVSLMPTGKETDTGHPVYRFNRIIDGAPKPAPAHTEKQPAPAAQQPPPKTNGNGKPAPKPTAAERPPWAAPGDFDEEWEQLPPAAQQPAQARALAQAAASRPAPAPAEQGALPFDSQYTAIKWAVGFAHYQKPDGSGDYPHAAGSHAKLCKQLGCTDKALDCWGAAWHAHVTSKAEQPAF